jgi:uncharacterized protein YndB with AHSA1/START domain
MKPEMLAKYGSSLAAGVRAGHGARRQPGEEPLLRSTRPLRPTIRVVCHYDAPVDEVFNAWLDAEGAGEWLFATASHPMESVRIDARPGGAFYLAAARDGEVHVYTGGFIEIVVPRRLDFTLAMSEIPNVVTRVAVELRSLGTGSELSLTHDNVPAAHIEYVDGRWSGILYGLGLMLESTATPST